jgi:hypothetical protein
MRNEAVCADQRRYRPSARALVRDEPSAGVPRKALVRSGAIEHPTYRDAIDAGGFDAEADDAAGENIHDQHHPMAA